VTCSVEQLVEVDVREGATTVVAGTGAGRQDEAVMERLPGHGLPSRLSTIRSSACASVAVPTVDRALAPIRSWSTMVAALNPSSRSTSVAPGSA
jgi:hypothetical protein